MTPFMTFGEPDPPADLDTAGGRVLWQEGMLSPLVSDVIGVGTARVKSQEDELASVYKPLIQQAKHRIRFQGDMLDSVAAVAAGHARTLVSSQAASLAALPGDLTTAPPDDGAPAAGVEGCTPPPYPLVPGWSPGMPDLMPDGWRSQGSIYTRRDGSMVMDGAIPPWSHINGGPRPASLPGADCVWNVAVLVGTPSPPPPAAPPTPPPASPPPPWPTVPPPPPPPPGCELGSFMPVTELFVKCPPGTTPPGSPPPPPATPPPTIPPTTPPPPPTPGGEFIPPVLGEALDWGLANVCPNASKYLLEEAKTWRPTGSSPGSAAFGGPAASVWSGFSSAMSEAWEAAKALGADMGGTFAEGINSVADIPIVGKALASAELGKLLEKLEGQNLLWPAATYASGQVIASAKRIEQTLGWPATYLVQADQYLLQFANPQYIPEQSGTDQAFLANRISFGQWECFTRANGNHPYWWQQTLFAKQSLLTIQELNGLRWRGVLTDAEHAAYMRSLGFLEPRNISLTVEASKYVAPASDAIHWTIRDVFDPAKLGLAEMRKEYEQQIGLKETLRASGIVPYQCVGEDGKTFTVDAPFNYWLASYDECSPTQVYEMLHRIRPGREKQYPLPGPAGSTVYPESVTIDTVRKLLKEKDYNPIWRDRLAAISYRVPGRIDVRRFYAVGVYGKPLGEKGWAVNQTGGYKPVGVAERELVESYLDQGYSPIDAAREGYYTSIEFDRSRRNKGSTRHLAAICRSYTLGAITYDAAVREAEFVTGDQQEAKRFIDLCDVDKRNKALAEAVAGIRKKFLTGEIGRQGAAGLLGKVGIGQARVGEYLELWDLTLQRRSREVTATQIVEWWRDGQLTRRDAIDRLQNIGWDEADAKRIMRHAELGQLARDQKERDRIARAQERERQRQLSQQERNRKEAESAANRALIRFLALRTEKNLRAWLADGSITADQVRQTFMLKGVDPADIERWLSTGEGDGG